MAEKVVEIEGDGVLSSKWCSLATSGKDAGHDLQTVVTCGTSVLPFKASASVAGMAVAA